jgi:DNA modification methylase
VWAKPNPMPSSVADRTTPAHEMVYLLTRSARYAYDADAIREPAVTTRPDLLAFGPRPDVDYPGHSNDRRRQKVPGGWDGGHGSLHREGRTAAIYRDKTAGGEVGDGRNKRSVWTVATEPYPDAHFATFPQALIEPMILAGCPEGGVVLDPFAGSGTVAVVAQRRGRKAVLIDLSPEYVAQMIRRVAAARSSGEGPAIDMPVPYPDGSLWETV